MSMKKRILPLLLALVLAIGLLPFSAMAATKSFDDFFDGLPLIAETEPGAPNSTNKWKVTTLDGEDVLMSGNAGKAYSSSTLQLTMTGSANLSFEYKVSTEAKYDKVTIKNGDTILVDGESGKQDWKRLEIDAAQGDVITVVYKKDSSGNENDDCVYVRSITAGTPIVVTLHANNGTEDTAAQNIYGGKGTLKANIFTCDGKVFAGWATSADGEVVYTDGASIEVTEALDLYAVWSDAYTVTFDYADSKTESKTVLVARNAKIGALNIPADPTLTGYTFGGWYNGEEQLTADTVISGDTTFTAKWMAITYTIAFSAGEGTADGTIESITATYNEEVTLPENTVFTRAGYTFNGWSTSSSSSSGSYAAGASVKNLSSKQGTTVTLYAAWKPLPVNVTLKLNYEGAEDVTRTGVVGSNYNYIQLEDGSTKYSSITDPVRTGYIFNGWFDAAEGGSAVATSYKFTAADAENGFTMFAQWTKGITVHFDGNGYKDTLADKTVKPESVYSSLPYTTSYYYPANKALDGWYIKNADGSFGEAVTKDTDFSGLDEVTLIAKWRDYQYVIKFNIKYSDKSSVTGTMADQIALFGQDVKLNKCAYTREGYDFAGWATSAYGSSIAHADEATINRAWDDDDWDGSEDNESYNLYAVWTEAKSDEQKEADAKLDAADTAITGTYNPTYGKDTNALDMINAKLTAAGITDVTVTVKAGASDNHSSYNYVGVSDDGTLEYKWNPNGTTPSTTGTVRPVFILTYTDAAGTTYTRETTNCLFSMGLDEEKAMAALKAVADRVAVPETVESADDLTSLPHYPLKAGVDESSVDYSTSTDLELWVTTTWTSSKTSVIAVTSVDYPYFSPYKATVTLPSNTDETVTLTATYTYSGRDDLKISKVYTVLVKGTDVVRPVDYNALLDKAMTEYGLTNPRNDTAIDLANVASDIQFFTTKNLNVISMRDYNTAFDGKYTPILITSSNEDVITSTDVANAARVVTYRPLPGAEAASVTLTVKILDRPSGEGKDYAGMTVLGSKDITVTVQPLTQDEIDTAAAFMKKVDTEEVYWEGIKKANTDKNNVTGDLRSFMEIVPDGDGYKFIRNSEDFNYNGVRADELDGWYESEAWRCFKSSHPNIIAHENLLLTQPQYNTEVTIQSVLTYTEYAKYYEKNKDNADYAQFAQFYRQPMSITVKVIGTDGEAPAANDIYTTVQIEGSAFNAAFADVTAEYTSKDTDQKTAMDAVRSILESKGYTFSGTDTYLTGVTDPKGTALTSADETYGPWSGWMFKVNGKVPMLDEETQARMDQYVLCDGDVVTLYYVACPTATGRHTPGTDGKCTMCGTEVGTTVVLGDVNGDGKVNNVDAALVYAYHNKKSALTEDQLAAADVNGDGKVNNTDAALIYAYHNKKLPKFPAA